MNRLIAGLVVALVCSVWATPSQAQFTSIPDDPFFLYYGYFLPRQQSIAAQAQNSAVATIRANAVQREYNAVAERSGLYEPIQPFGMEDLNPDGVAGGRTLSRRYSRTVVVTPGLRSAPHVSSGYHNRTGSYFPGSRTGASMGNGPVGGPAPRQSMGVPGVRSRVQALNSQMFQNVPGPYSGMPGAGAMRRP